MPKTAFLPIASPKLVDAPPSGREWLHELKYDGFRLQVHVADRTAHLYSKSGEDFTSRYPLIAGVGERLRVRSAVIDGELIACTEDGRPDFYALLARRPAPLCVVCFDLLMLDGLDLRPLPLHIRRAKLAPLIAEGTTFILSQEYRDGDALLAMAEQAGLEGIVSKKRESAYVAGPTSTWLKTKTAAWRAANRRRWELFGK